MEHTTRAGFAVNNPEQVRELRRLMASVPGCTRDDVAIAAGVSRRTVFRWLSGRYAMPYDKMLRVRRELRCCCPLCENEKLR